MNPHQLRPNRRRGNLIRRPLPGVLFPAAGKSAFGDEVHVPLARNLATQPKTVRSAQTSRLQNRSLGLRHLIWLTLNETHPASRALGVSPARMQLIDLRLIHQSQNQPLPDRHVKCSNSFNS
jgi:hypothetical protein